MSKVGLCPEEHASRYPQSLPKKLNQVQADKGSGCLVVVNIIKSHGNELSAL